MENLCLKAGIHGMITPPNVVTKNRTNMPSYFSVKEPSSSSSLPRGFLFPCHLRSVMPNGGKIKYGAIRVDDASLDDGEENVDVANSLSHEEGNGEEEESEGGHENWVMKILHVTSLGKYGNGERAKLDDQNVDDDDDKNEENGGGGCGGVDKECEGCCIDDDDEEEEEERTEFDQESFSRLLKRVSLAEARLYGKLSYLGSLAYEISLIKPKNLLRYHKLRFVTSSFEKKEQAVSAEREKALAEGEQPGKENVSAEAAQLKESKMEQADREKKAEGEKLSRSASYEIAASAASYLYSCTQSLNPFRTSKSTQGEDLSECDKLNLNHENVASFMATTESVTSVVAAKEEVNPSSPPALSFFPNCIFFL